MLNYRQLFIDTMFCKDLYVEYTFTLVILDQLRRLLVRVDGRSNIQSRDVQITPSYLLFPEGSTLIQVGNTKVICTASVEERVPPFLRGQGRGWVTAEYGMLPRSTLTRQNREGAVGRIAGRTQEIQRLIGRSLRAVVDLTALGERSILLDCDVIQADGGTRTAAITGSYVAVYQALLHMVNRGILESLPLDTAVAAISVGLVDGEVILDLCYEEDSRADVDFNVVMTKDGDLIEVQGTAEGVPFSRTSMDEMLEASSKGIQAQMEAQILAIDGLMHR